MITRCFYGPGRHPSICRFLSAKSELITSAEVVKRSMIFTSSYELEGVMIKKETKKMITVF